MENHKVSRLKLLKTKEKDLINESNISNSLINQVLMKIHNAINNLEETENKSYFRRLFLSTLCLTDRLNQILLEINLELEDFILDKQIYKNNDSNFSFKISSLKRSRIKSPSKNVNSTKLPHENPSNTTHLCNNEKLNNTERIIDKSLELVQICEQPASLHPVFLNRNVKKNREHMSSQVVKKVINSSKLTVENILESSQSNCQEICPTENKTSDKLSTNINSELSQPNNREVLNEMVCNLSNDDHKIIKNTKSRELTVENLPDQSHNDSELEISKRKVLEFLSHNSNKQLPPRHCRFSEQKRAIRLGAPGFKKSKFSVSKIHKNLNLISSTDSYDDEEDFANTVTTKSNCDEDICKLTKDMSITIEQKTENSLQSLEEVNQNCRIKHEEFSVKECNVEQTTKLMQVDKNKCEEFQDKVHDLQKCPREISEKKVPRIIVVNDDRCIVTHAVSPGCFYIITASATENIIDYDRFHEELQVYCDSSNARKFSTKNEIKDFGGTYYCCFNEMNDYNYNWFRCEIIDWLLLDDEELKNKVKILAVDDGFENNVCIDQIRDYPQTNYFLPKMAIKCRLRNLYPPNSTKNNILDTWPEKSIEFFNDLIQNSRVNPFYVTDVNQLLDCYEVDLCNNQRVSLSKVMVQMDLAFIIEPCILIPEFDKEMIKSEFMKEQIKQAQGFIDNYNNEDALDNLDDCKTNLNQAICDHLQGGYQPKDHLRLCKFTKINNEKCFKGDNCKFEHKLPDPDGWTTDKIEVFTTTVNQIEQPNIGEKFDIMVTFVKTICRFYAHIKLSKQKKQIYAASKIIYTANQFSKYINKPEIISGLKKLKILPALGQLVLARSPSDNKWYRGRVITINSEDNIEVFFIDYGDVCIVKFNDLREIKIEHLGLPEQAVEFRIHGIDPIDSESSFKAAHHLVGLILDQRLSAIVINNGYPIEVQIYTDDGVNIGNYLKMQNLARDRDLQLVPKMGDSVLE